MNNTDQQLLKELCKQYDVSFDKVNRLLETVKEFQFRDRRTGIYEELKSIIRSETKTEGK